MKYDIERIALWVIVVILAIAVFFPRRGSGFVLPSGADTKTISIMDLKEFSNVSEDRVNNYKTNILTRSNLMSIASMTTPGIIGKLDTMLTAGLAMRQPTTTQCPPNSTRNTLTGQCICNPNYTWSGMICVACPPGTTRTGAMASGTATQCTPVTR